MGEVEAALYAFCSVGAHTKRLICGLEGLHYGSRISVSRICVFYRGSIFTVARYLVHLCLYDIADALKGRAEHER